MQKINRFIICITSVILIICLICYISIRGKNHLYVPQNMIEINNIEFKDKVTKENTFILYVYGDSCKYCEEFSPRFDKVLKSEVIKCYKISSDRNDEYYKTVSNLLGDKFQGTPAVYFYKDGKLIDYFIGNKESDDVKKYIDKYKTS